MENPTTENEPVETTTPAAPAVEQTQEETVETTVETTPVEATTEPPASGSETTENSGIDYAAEYEKTLKQLGQAEHVIEVLKKKPSTEAPAPEEEPEPTPVPQPQQDIAEIVRQEVEVHMGPVVADTVETIAESLTDNPDERKLMMLLYDKKVQKSGFSRAQIREDLELALAMANSKKLINENSELKRTVRTKKTIVNAAPGDNQSRFEPAAPVAPLSDADKAVMEHYGIKPEEVQSGGVVS